MAFNIKKHKDTANVEKFINAADQAPATLDQKPATAKNTTESETVAKRQAGRPKIRPETVRLCVNIDEELDQRLRNKAAERYAGNMTAALEAILWGKDKLNEKL